MKRTPYDIAMDSPALKELSDSYPPNRYGKVPLKIRMAIAVKSDLPFFRKEYEHLLPEAEKGKEYFVWVNSHGAMSAIMENGEQLGIKPSECEIIEWHK